MPSILEAVAILQAHSAPVVFLDTCVLLDIIRAPLRNSVPVVRAATELLIGTRQKPPTVHLVIGYPTPTEWNEHVDEAVTDCCIAVNSVNAVSEAWGLLGTPGIPLLPDRAMTLPDRLLDLSETLRDTAILLGTDVDVLSRAFDRVIKSELPAKRGGKGAKDAVILEQALGLTNALRAVGSLQICIFVSSNTSDFAISKTTKLHPALAPAFASANLHYAASLTEAATSLKEEGWVPAR